MYRSIYGRGILVWKNFSDDITSQILKGGYGFALKTTPHIKMRFLWIGVNISGEMKARILQSGGKLLSGYISQENIIDGIDSLNIPMDSINSYQISHKVLFRVPREEWTRNGKSRDISVAYLNIKYINHMIRSSNLIKEVRRWAKTIKNDEEIYVIVYSLHTPYLKAARELKRIFPNIKVTTIVLDLPQYMDLAMSFTKHILKKIDYVRIRSLMKYVDNYILYAKTMADFLQIPANRFLVWEGSYDPSYLPKGNKVKNKRVTVMYSGILDLRYGIKELLDSMKLLDDNYELLITGNEGNAVKMIMECAEKDERIKYLGYLPSRRDLLETQYQADMLISPRRDSEDASKYCFPSKLFEYMASGNPVLSCRLAGIPEEYFDYLVEIPTITPESIASTIESVARMSEERKRRIGEESREFVVREKNKYAQSKRIIDFILKS